MFSQEIEWLLQEKYGGQKSGAFLTDVTRLQAGEPLAYIIGHIPFLNTTIWLDSKPLIPRPETEYWVEVVINEIQNSQEKSIHPLRILDLCAGSGCIGVAIAKSRPSILIDFIELEKSHLATIRKNCLHNDVQESRFRIFQGNLFSPISPMSVKYDFIVSNPPYIDPSLDRTEPAVKKFEPATALYGGKNGVVLIEKIITEAPKYLSVHGQLWLEHEPEQTELIHQLANSNYQTTTELDQYNNNRFSKLMLQ